MAETLSLLMAEDDDGHATLVRRSLKRAGLESELVHLRDGQELLDYVQCRGAWTHRRPHRQLAILLDLNMPRLDGTAVLERLKSDEDLARYPVFVLTTTDNPAELDRCYGLGASVCLVKPVDYGAFDGMIRRLADLLMTARFPGEQRPCAGSS